MIIPAQALILMKTPAQAIDCDYPLFRLINRPAV
jgi:hypothetical protein